MNIVFEEIKEQDLTEVKKIKIMKKDKKNDYFEPINRWILTGFF
jgi:hypothetical protein